MEEEQKGKKQTKKKKERKEREKKREGGEEANIASGRYVQASAALLNWRRVIQVKRATGVLSGAADTPLCRPELPQTDWFVWLHLHGRLSACWPCLRLPACLPACSYTSAYGPTTLLVSSLTACLSASQSTCLLACSPNGLVTCPSAYLALACLLTCLTACLPACQPPSPKHKHNIHSQYISRYYYRIFYHAATRPVNRASSKSKKPLSVSYPLSSDKNHDLIVVINISIPA